MIKLMIFVMFLHELLNFMFLPKKIKQKNQKFY